MKRPSWSVLLSYLLGTLCPVCVWMGVVSASLQSFPKRKIDSDVEVIHYLRLERQWLQRLPSGRLWGMAGWKSVGGALPGEGDRCLSGQGWWCSCRAIFSGMIRGAAVRGAGEEVHVSLSLLRNVSHWLALLLAERRNALIKLNKDFKSQQKNLGYSSLW